MKARNIGMIIAAASACNAPAQTWTNLSGGAFNTAGNWSPNTVPGLGATANITQRGGPYTVFLDTAVTNATVFIGGRTGVGDTDITLDLSGGGSLAATTRFEVSNTGDTPNNVTVKDGALDVEYAVNNNLAFANASSNNELLFENVDVRALGTGGHRTSTFANSGSGNSSNNRMDIRGDSTWFWDNPAAGDGFLCIFAGTGGLATNNHFTASGPDVKLVFANSTFNTMRGGNNGTGVIEDNTVTIEDGAQVVCSNRIQIAEGAMAHNNLLRVTGPGTKVWTKGTSGDAGASGGLSIGFVGSYPGPYSGSEFPTSNNTFRIDNGAHVVAAAGTNPNGPRAVVIGGNISTRNTLKVDSGATLELASTLDQNPRMLVGAGSASNPAGNNAAIIDNATFYATNGIVSIGTGGNCQNSLTLCNGALFSNVTATAGASILFTVGADTALSNTVTITDSVFYHASDFRIGGGGASGGVTSPLPRQGRFHVGSNATATVTGAIWLGSGGGTCDNLLEVSDGGKFYNPSASSLNIGRNSLAGTGYNVLRVTGAGSVASFSATIAVGSNANAEGNRVELLDGGELAVNTRYLRIGYTVGSKKNVLRIHDGILTNLNLLVDIAGTNRLEVSGAKSEIHIDQLALGVSGNPATAVPNGHGAELEFTIGRDGIAPIVMEKARAGIPNAKIKVNVNRYPGGTLPLIINNTPVAVGAQEFAPENVDIPLGCELVYSPNDISITCPFIARTLFLVR